VRWTDTASVGARSVKFWLGNLKKGENFENLGIEANIQMDHTEMGCAEVNWMQLAQGTIR
jgi:hypothetical protein